jgi:hypothetical protein
VKKLCEKPKLETISQGWEKSKLRNVGHYTTNEMAQNNDGGKKHHGMSLNVNKNRLCWKHDLPNKSSNK